MWEWVTNWSVAEVVGLDKGVNFVLALLLKAISVTLERECTSAGSHKPNEEERRKEEERRELDLT